ncbi:hypothetical protein CRYUN_Cryun07bG0004900 [Craigia yunnanensis]
MGVRYLAISAFSTALSFLGLQFWTEFSLDKLHTDGLISENFIHTENANRALEFLLGSYATVVLLANFVLNVFILLIVSLKIVFFGGLYPSETCKLVEHLINYVVYKNVIRSELLDGWRPPGEDSTAGSCELFLGCLNIWIHETLFRTRFSGHLDLAGICMVLREWQPETSWFLLEIFQEVSILSPSFLLRTSSVSVVYNNRYCCTGSVESIN